MMLDVLLETTVYNEKEAYYDQIKFVIFQVQAQIDLEGIMYNYILQ